MTNISMPAGAEFVQCSFSLQFNTQTFTSPLTRSTQTQEIPGARWSATYQVTVQRGEAIDADDMHGKWKAFLTKCRGGANRFYGYDPNIRVPRGSSGQGVPASTTDARAITPSGSLTPGAPLVPHYEGFAAVAASTSCSVKDAVASGNSVRLTGLEAWDYSQGVNTLVEASYYFKPGDYFQVGNELKMVTDYSVDDKQAGDAVVTFEPPIRVPFTAGQSCVIQNPTCLMRLSDDNQGNWSITGGHFHQFSFSGMESFV